MFYIILTIAKSFRSKKMYIQECSIKTGLIPQINKSHNTSSLIKTIKLFRDLKFISTLIYTGHFKALIEGCIANHALKHMTVLAL